MSSEQKKSFFLKKNHSQNSSLNLALAISVRIVCFGVFLEKNYCDNIY